jgi:hypothetical protein
MFDAAYVAKLYYATGDLQAAHSIPFDMFNTAVLFTLRLHSFAAQMAYDVAKAALANDLQLSVAAGAIGYGIFFSTLAGSYSIALVALRELAWSVSGAKYVSLVSRICIALVFSLCGAEVVAILSDPTDFNLEGWHYAVAPLSSLGSFVPNYALYCVALLVVKAVAKLRIARNGP